MVARLAAGRRPGTRRPCGGGSETLRPAGVLRLSHNRHDRRPERSRPVARGHEVLRVRPGGAARRPLADRSHAADLQYLVGFRGARARCIPQDASVRSCQSEVASGRGESQLVEVADRGRRTRGCSKPEGRRCGVPGQGPDLASVAGGAIREPRSGGHPEVYRRSISPRQRLPPQKITSHKTNAASTAITPTTHPIHSMCSLSSLQLVLGAISQFDRSEPPPSHRPAASVAEWLLFTLAEPPLMSLEAHAAHKGCEGLGFALMMSARNGALSVSDIHRLPSGRPGPDRLLPARLAQGGDDGPGPLGRSPSLGCPDEPRRSDGRPPEPVPLLQPPFGAARQTGPPPPRSRTVRDATRADHAGAEEPSQPRSSKVTSWR